MTDCTAPPEAFGSLISGEFSKLAAKLARVVYNCLRTIANLYWVRRAR
ncbi:MAG: hypothetical protein ACRD6B_18330 [Bryobacteraceae bacterium]